MRSCFRQPRWWSVRVVAMKWDKDGIAINDSDAKARFAGVKRLDMYTGDLERLSLFNVDLTQK